MRMTVLLLLLCSGCATQRPRLPDPLAALFEAFNRHDPAAMAALVHPQFEYLLIDAGKANLEATGPAALETSPATSSRCANG